MSLEAKLEKLESTVDPVEHAALVDAFFVERALQVAAEINMASKQQEQTEFGAWGSTTVPKRYNESKAYE